MDDIAVKLPKPVLDPVYYIEGESLVIVRGTEGHSIDKCKAAEIILGEIRSGNNEEINLELIVIRPNEIDLEKIHR